MFFTQVHCKVKYRYLSTKFHKFSEAILVLILEIFSFLQGLKSRIIQLQKVTVTLDFLENLEFYQVFNILSFKQKNTKIIMKKIKLQYRDLLLTILVIVLIINVLQNQILLHQLTTNKNQEKENITNFARHTSNPQNFAILPVNPDGSLDIRVKGFSEKIEVDIDEISTFDELDINIDEVRGYSTNALKVEVKD